MPAVYDPLLETTMVLDEGAIYINDDTPAFVLQGPIKVDFGETWQNMGFAGKRAPVAGLDRKTYQDCKITGTMITLDATSTAIIFPGSTQTGSTHLVVTPKPMSQLLDASTDYETNVRGIFKRADGVWISVTMAKALIHATGMDGADKDQVGIPIMVEARQDLSASTDTDVAPVVVEILSTLALS